MSGKDDKRTHHRFALAYPIRLFSRGGQELAQAETVNLSKSGALFMLSADIAEELDSTLNVAISIPNGAYESERTLDFACRAEIVRQHADAGGDQVGIALAFTEPMAFEA